MLELNLIYILTVVSLISIQWDRIDASPLLGVPTAQHIQDVRKKTENVQALPSNLQKKSKLDKTQKKSSSGPHVHPALTTNFIQMVAEEGEETPTEEVPAGGEGGEGAGGDGGGTAGEGEEKIPDKQGENGDKTAGEKGDKTDDKNGDKTGNKTDDKAGNKTGNAVGYPDEITVSVPKFQKDHMGNWIYHKWGATFGQVWGDTRFNKGRFTIPRIKVDSNAPNDYYPDGPRSTVCMGSTVYNVPRVQSWLRRNVYTEEHKHRPFWDNLRQIIFTQGNSEECHDAEKYKDWKDYQECALRRNQRLEYMVPKYPAHQIGYRGTKPKNPAK